MYYNTLKTHLTSKGVIMTQKPYVQRTIRSTDSDFVTKAVEKLVRDLVKKGYRVKIVVENYNHVYEDHSTRMVYQSTIQASAHKNVVIDFTK
jgi:hypothetical protein